MPEKKQKTAMDRHGTQQHSFGALTAWRALAALCIVLFHYEVGGFSRPTWFGVSMFFVMSGFLLAWHHAPQMAARRLRRAFVLTHVPRLYFINWLALLLLLPLGAMASARWLLPDALLLQAWLPWHDAVYSGNSVAWFLSALVLCYCAFPILARAVAAAPWLLCLCAVAAMAAGQCALVRWVGGDAAYTFPLSRIQDFALGVVLCRLARSRRSAVNATLWQLLAVALVTAAMAASQLWPGLLAGYDSVVLWWPPAAAVVLAFSLDGGIPARALTRCAPLQWVGAMSMEVYVLQCVAPQVWNRVLAPAAAHFGCPDAYRHYALPSVALLLALAWAVRKCITAPLWRKLSMSHD
ncbi:MAG: acyltransferase [Sodaliphilus sp.]|nr:acyltransferase [Sodaliphilus sp.]